MIYQKTTFKKRINLKTTIIYFTNILISVLGKMASKLVNPTNLYYRAKDKCYNL